MPRRRGAKAAAIEVEEERGLVMRILLHSPKDMVAGLLAAAAICAILANALFLQAGRHPSPMFGSVVTLPAPQAAVVSPLPRPRPVELTSRPGDAGGNLQIRARPQAPGDRANVRSAGEGAYGDDRASDRLGEGVRPVRCMARNSLGATPNRRSKALLSRIGVSPTLAATPLSGKSPSTSVRAASRRRASTK